MRDRFWLQTYKKNPKRLNALRRFSQHSALSKKWNTDYTDAADSQRFHRLFAPSLARSLLFVSLSLRLFVSFSLPLSFALSVSQSLSPPSLLNKPSSVSLEIFDALGRKIETIVTGIQKDGNYSYKFNSKKDAVQNGIYIIKFIVNNTVYLKKIIESKQF